MCYHTRPDAPALLNRPSSRLCSRMDPSAAASRAAPEQAEEGGGCRPFPHPTSSHWYRGPNSSSLCAWRYRKKVSAFLLPTTRGPLAVFQLRYQLIVSLSPSIFKCCGKKRVSQQWCSGQAVARWIPSLGPLWAEFACPPDTCAGPSGSSPRPQPPCEVDWKLSIRPGPRPARCVSLSGPCQASHSNSSGVIGRLCGPLTQQKTSGVELPSDSTRMIRASLSCRK